MGVEVHQFACLEDNYGFLIRDTQTGDAATIDTPDATAVLREAAALGWRLTTILNTHWHPDHASGNAAVKTATGAEAIGPAEVSAHFPIDRVIVPGDRITLGQTAIDVIESGGHTLGHIAFYLPDDALLFAGDTIFPMGCGRLFEGTPAQMWHSLGLIAALPRKTKIYAAHEYAPGNARFAIEVDGSPAVAARAESLLTAVARGESSVPTTVGLECDTNPFLRAANLAIADGTSDPVEAFARVRAAKDAFKG